MHPWDVDRDEAIAIQRRLRPLVRHSGIALEQIRTVAGIDASYGDDGKAAVVLLSFPDLHVLETTRAQRRSIFPYVPGLLSFREVPLVLEALARLRATPDLLMVDGHGYAHPRRFGLACHLGVSLDRPCLGCAKSRLTGTYQDPGPASGDRSPLRDADETIGAVLRSKPRTNPLFVSIGHRIDLETAVQVVLHCLRGYRLPEPTRLADRLAARPLTPEDLKPARPTAADPLQPTLFDA